MNKVIIKNNSKAFILDGLKVTMKNIHTMGFMDLSSQKYGNNLSLALSLLLSLFKGNKMKSGFIISFLLEINITHNVISRAEGGTRLHLISKQLTEK